MRSQGLKDYASLIRHGGNIELFAAVEMSVASTVGGLPLHLHVEGVRGTGKTSALRATQELLPLISRILGCPYNCDPADPHCPDHRGLEPEKLEKLGTELVPMPFLEISHAAKVGTVVGSLDLRAITNADRPSARVLPGTLAQAHRGIVFIDEINRLAETSPELADVLLDAMGTKPGRIQIEESGLPRVQIPVRVSVWAASNPDEDPGPLEEVRRQLSDRFDFAVKMGRPSAVEEVEAILGEAPAWLRSKVAKIYLRFGLESLRAAEALVLGSRASAARAGRPEVGLEDLKSVLPLVLRHRVESETLSRIVKWLEEEEESRGHIASALPVEERKATSLINGLSERFRTLVAGLGQDGRPAPPAESPELSPPGRAAQPMKELDPDEWVKSWKDLIR